MKNAFFTVGIDGCKDGWMVAVLSTDSLMIERHVNKTDAMGLKMQIIITKLRYKLHTIFPEPLIDGAFKPIAVNDSHFKSP